MVMRRWIYVGLLACFPSGHGVLLAQSAAADLPTPEAIENFEINVRPVLAMTCGKCHGSEKATSNLRFDSRSTLLTCGDHGPAIVPGDADASLLIHAIRRTYDEVAMPPDEELPSDDIDHLHHATHERQRYRSASRKQPVRLSNHLRTRTNAAIPIDIHSV